jgi:hypothetical protein
MRLWTAAAWSGSSLVIIFLSKIFKGTVWRGYTDFAKSGRFLQIVLSKRPNAVHLKWFAPPVLLRFPAMISPRRCSIQIFEFDHTGHLF